MQQDRPTPDQNRLRILIVDHHEVSRAACAALLRTEGLIVADVASLAGLLARARLLTPDLVLIDATPGAAVGWAVSRVRALPSPPMVLLTSSAQPDQLHPSLASLPFLPKADICAREILAAVAAGTNEPRVAAGGDEPSAAAQSE
jgi:CheY-like chemotaxis protein